MQIGNECGDGPGHAADADATAATRTTLVAPPLAVEQSDRAVRGRRRRERPRRLRLDGPFPFFPEGPGASDDSDDATRASVRDDIDVFDPDVASFVSACLPGASFSDGSVGWKRNAAAAVAGSSSRKVKPFRDRSLPLLSFLASTSLAAAEKLRKKTQQELERSLEEGGATQNSAAALSYDDQEGAAATGRSFTPTGTARFDEISSGDARKFDTGNAQRGMTAINTLCAAGSRQCTVSPESGGATTTTTAVTIEKASNVLMPPLLKSFLASVNTK